MRGSPIRRRLITTASSPTCVTNVDPVDVSSLGFRTDLMVLQLGGSEVIDRGDYLVARTASNPTYYWGNFLLIPEPIRHGHGKAWLDRFREEFPGAVHRAMGLNTTDGDAGDRDELAALGLEANVSTVLSATSLAEPAAPVADVRRLATADDWQQAYALRSAVYGEPDGPSIAMFQARQIDASRSLTESGCAAWFGAFVDGQLVASLGIVSDGAGLARYQSVETHPEFRRRGLARRLLCDASSYATTQLNATSLVIVADPDDDAIKLYRSAGFVDAEQQVQLQAPSP